ncbi:hypothetical protein G6F62_015981 [Rhizopus arrhizus]|nr:hypothetical protein G6F62_015981 [Rhizopus arrhizus]KAG1597097.1 hypothetical protein G6F46_014331 [Rhizopus delemar]
MTPITVQMINDRLFDSQARREVWVTPLPMFSCHGLGSAAWAHANAGTSPPATVAATAATHFVPHLLLCFIA